MMLPGSRYRVETNGSWEDFAQRWQRLAASNLGSPFQNANWLDAWFATLGRRTDIEPVLVSVSDPVSQVDLLLLPLVRRRSGPVRIVEFADLWVSDYCEPCLGPHAPTDRDASQQMLDQIALALAPADLIMIDKMPGYIGERINPLTLCANVTPSGYSGHWIDLDRKWDDYLLSLKKNFRSELRRSMRLLEAEGRVGIRMAETAEEAADMLAVLDRLQCARFEAMGIRHPFAGKTHQDFYRAAVSRGVADGSVMVSAISVDDQMVACSLMVRARQRFTLMRFGFQTGKYDRIGLGRLIVEQTIKLAHERGCTLLDLSIGATDLKRRLGATTEIKLFELNRSLSWTGATVASYQRARRMASSSQVLRTIKNRLSGHRERRLADEQEHF
jgi:CelD/BcsL family acetyltransferase involved in cellulose biosynthesis